MAIQTVEAEGKRAVLRRPPNVSFSNIIGGGIVPVVVAKEEILGAIQTSRADGGESQTDCHRMSWHRERFRRVQEKVNQRPGWKQMSVRVSEGDWRMLECTDIGICHFRCGCRR